MRDRKKNLLLDLLKDKGLIDDSLTTKNLTISFADFLKQEADNELELLSEVLRIKEKKEKGEPLTYLENSFYNFFITSYS